MSEARECDICHRFYRAYNKEFTRMELWTDYGNRRCKVDLCPTCQKAIETVRKIGFPKWIPEEDYDVDLYGYVLVRTVDPETGELEKIPRVARKDPVTEYWEDIIGQILTHPVRYFADLEKIGSLLDASLQEGENND